MTADTLSAEEREALFGRAKEDVEFAVGPDGSPSRLALVATADLINLIRLAKLATPELIALGEAERYELVEALVEAEAGFELTGFDKPVEEGHAAPSGTAALLHIRKVLAKYPDLVNRVWDSVKTPCEGCGKPSDFTDDDGVGTCAECARAHAASIAEKETQNG